MTFEYTYLPESRLVGEGLLWIVDGDVGGEGQTRGRATPPQRVLVVQLHRHCEERGSNYKDCKSWTKKTPCTVSLVVLHEDLGEVERLGKDALLVEDVPGEPLVPALVGQGLSLNDAQIAHKSEPEQ